MIEIENLHVEVDGKAILQGLSLILEKGKIHAIMGPNGAGKSTLAKVVAGDPSYVITEGDIRFNGKSILDMEPEERSLLGLFIGFQYPIEIAGISNEKFLLAACRARGKEEGFTERVREKMAEMQIRPEFLERDINSGFSGGEKKRNEILQMLLLEPSVAILDETDSGLDIDAMKIVAEGVNRFMAPDKSLLLITHYHRLLSYIKPDVVHVMIDGRIVESGGPELALQLEEEGYEAKC